MPELVIPSRLFNPRTVLGVDENNDFRVIIVDTEGHPQVDVPDLDFDVSGRLRVTSEVAEVGYVMLRDKKTIGTHAGTFGSGGWLKRDLNEEVVDTGNVCVLADSEFTLQPAIYEFAISCPALAVERHQARLYNVTDSTVVAIGTNGSSSAGGGDVTLSFVRGRFEITSEKTFRVEHRCQTTVVTAGLGYACNWGEEVYAICELWGGERRVAETYDYVQLRHKETSGTNGGTATSGDWEIRTLNEELFDTGGICSLAANVFTLDAGTYFFNIACPALAVSRHQARLYNISDSNVDLLGSNAATDPAGGEVGYSLIKGRLVLTSSKSFRIEHRVTSSLADVGYGFPTSWGDEIYSVMECYRVAE